MLIRHWFKRKFKNMLMFWACEFKSFVTPYLWKKTQFISVIYTNMEWQIVHSPLMCQINRPGKRNGTTLNPLAGLSTLLHVVVVMLTITHNMHTDEAWNLSIHVTGCLTCHSSTTHFFLVVQYITFIIIHLSLTEHYVLYGFIWLKLVTKYTFIKTAI